MHKLVSLPFLHCLVFHDPTFSGAKKRYDPPASTFSQVFFKYSVPAGRLLLTSPSQDTDFNLGKLQKQLENLRLHKCTFQQRTSLHQFCNKWCYSSALRVKCISRVPCVNSFGFETIKPRKFCYDITLRVKCALIMIMIMITTRITITITTMKIVMCLFFRGSGRNTVWKILTTWRWVFQLISQVYWACTYLVAWLYCHLHQGKRNFYSGSLHKGKPIKTDVCYCWNYKQSWLILTNRLLIQHYFHRPDQKG